MALTNLLFSFLAWSGKSELFFAFAVVMDDLTGAFATVVFVAFISMLVDRTYTATQYALLASIGTAGRTLFASWSGAMVDWLDGDWGLFFRDYGADGFAVAFVSLGNSPPTGLPAGRGEGANLQ